MTLVFHEVDEERMPLEMYVFMVMEKYKIGLKFKLPLKYSIPSLI